MAFDGSGNYVRNYNWTQDAANAIPITASRFDTEHNGFAAGLSNCITRDGQGKPTSDISWQSHGITNLRDPTANQEPVTLAFANSDSGFLQVQSTRFKYVQTAAESAASVTPISTAYDVTPYGEFFRYCSAAQIASILAFDYVQDVTSAMNAAFSLPGETIHLPRGGYKYTANLASPQCDQILGQSELSTILKPSAAVTRGLSLGHVTSSLRKLARLQIDGTNTTNGIGIFAGEASTWNGLMEEVRVLSFTGASAVGVRVGDTLKAAMRLVTVSGCNTNMTHEKVSAGFPTTLETNSVTLTNAVVNSLVVKDCDSIIHTNLIVESAGQEGVIVLPNTNGTVKTLVLDKPRFEGNYGSNTAKYQFVAGDGANPEVNGRVIQIKLRNPKFQTTGSTAKAMSLNGAAVVFVVDDPKVDSVVTGAISVTNNASGIIRGIPEDVFWTVVSDANNQVTAPDKPSMRSWTPTYASSVGNAATSFSGAITTNWAKYNRDGLKHVECTMDFSGTLNAVTPNYVNATLPTNLTPTQAQIIGTAIVVNGVNLAGEIRLQTDGTVRFYKADESNFTSAGTFNVRGTFGFEIN